jgi:hypothetical protein
LARRSAFSFSGSRGSSGSLRFAERRRHALNGRLPREIRGGGSCDRRRELLVVHAGHDPLQIRWEREHFRYRARDATLGRSLDRCDRPHVKAQLARLHAARAKAHANLFGQERQLVRPNARRRSQEHDPVGHGERLRVFRDARADRVAPDRGRDRRLQPREPALAGAIEDAIERLRSEERLSRGAAHDLDLGRA